MRQTKVQAAAVTALVFILATSSALANDNVITGNPPGKWHWSGAVVYYRLAAYTLPAGFQAAIDNAAAKWTAQTAIFEWKAADVSNTNYDDSSTQIVWYGAIPGAWQTFCPTGNTIACTRGRSNDSVSKHFYDMDTVWQSGTPYTNTCPWWPGAFPDIESIFLHEFGHWGWLGHSSDGGTVMQVPYVTCNQNLSQHDKDSMNTLYVH